jgi:hypothetical protein
VATAAGGIRKTINVIWIKIEVNKNANKKN